MYSQGKGMHVWSIPNTDINNKGYVFIAQKDSLIKYTEYDQNVLVHITQWEDKAEPWTKVHWSKLVLWKAPCHG